MSRVTLVKKIQGFLDPGISWYYHGEITSLVNVWYPKILDPIWYIYIGIQTVPLLFHCPNGSFSRVLILLFLVIHMILDLSRYQYIHEFHIGDSLDY